MLRATKPTVHDYRDCYTITIVYLTNDRSNDMVVEESLSIFSDNTPDKESNSFPLVELFHDTYTSKGFVKYPEEGDDDYRRFEELEFFKVGDYGTLGITDVFFNYYDENGVKYDVVVE